MLLSVLFATLMNAHARLPGPVADRVRPTSVCAALLELVTPEEGREDRTQEAWAMQKEFARLYLPIPSDVERSEPGQFKVMSSRGGRADALASARRLYALNSRDEVVGDVSDVLTYLTDLREIMKEHNVKDAKRTRRHLRSYSLIPLTGVAIIGASFFVPQPGMRLSGVAIALLHLKQMVDTVRSFRGHLEDASSLLGQVGLNPKAREWVHLHAVTLQDEVVDILVYATENGEPRLASFISK